MTGGPAEGTGGGTDDEIRFQRRNGLTIVTLNRPRALNALTFGMCRTLYEKLGAWRDDPDLSAVLVRGAGERAFCAGGDIRWVAELIEREGVEAAARFFATEYALNARLFHFPKPYVAVLDGVVMGGGVGISIHGRYRIATERTVFAMPETGIGFFPDVGGTWVLPRLPGEVGMYLGLTGARIGAADCLRLGIATHVVEPARLAELEDRLAALEPGADYEARLAATLDRCATEPGPAPIERIRAPIDRCFAGRRLEDVLDALAAEPSGFGEEVLATLASKSPTSLKVAFEQLRRGRALTRFDDAMRLEYRLVHRFLAGHDFREGVRALIIDKDNRPAWRPDALERVRADEVERHFAPLPAGELELPDEGARR